MIVSHSPILFTNYKVHLWELSMLITYVLCLVAQLCLTLCNPMDCGPPGSSVRGGSPGKHTEVGCHALLQGIFPTQVSRIASRFFTLWAIREALVTYRWILFILLFSSFLSYIVILSTHFLTHRLLQVWSLFWKCLQECLSRVPLCACVGASRRPVPGREWKVLVCPVLSARAILIFSDTSAGEYLSSMFFQTVFSI